MSMETLKKVFSVHVYVVHSRRLAGRLPGVLKLKDSLASETTSEGAVSTKSFELVCDHEPSELDAARVKEVANVSGQGLPPPFNQATGPIHINQLSNVLNHHTCLTRSAACPPSDVCLVVEDDVLYNEDTVKEAVRKTLEHAPAQGWDILFLGLPCTIKNSGDSEDVPRFQPTSEVFRMLPCCDSYLITPATARVLLKDFLPVRFPTHIQLSYLIQKHGLRVYVTWPNVFLDGSKLGAYTSSLNWNNRLSWNPWYVKLNALVKGANQDSPPSLFSEIDNIYSTMNFKEHPDVTYMYALSHIKRKNYVRAKDLMDAAYRMYGENGCILNKGSEFLNTYCDLFSHVQDVTL